MADCGFDYETAEARRDPPDVIVRSDGKVRLEIEVSDYHAGPERVAIGKRSKDFGDRLNRMVEQYPDLKGVGLHLLFKDELLPQWRDHETLCAEIVRCVRQGRDVGWLAGWDRQLSFENYVQPDTFDEIDQNWLVLPPKQWPVLAQHISSIYYSFVHYDDFMRSNSIQSAWPGPDVQVFRSIFDLKEQKIRRAIDAGEYSKDNHPLWLLIVCNTQHDLASWIFNNERLKAAIEASGFHHDRSIFDEVWLMSAFRKGGSRRLCPWSDQIVGA